jgi:2-C-methyl-D-erythritol 4-phosphate cytidylyltransferase
VGSVVAVIVAAGAGSRMGGVQAAPKQFLTIAGAPILAHTLSTFEACPEIEDIILVARPEHQPECEHLLTEYGLQKVTAIVSGGTERQDSVWQGVAQAPLHTEIVVIHDAVRMFVTQQILTASIQAAREYGACVVAVPIKDTVKRARADSPNEAGSPVPGFVATTLNRQELWQAQTPQTFQYQLILDIHHQAQQRGIRVTDDAALAEYFEHPVKIVQGSYRNIKITTPDDLMIAQAFFQHENIDKSGLKR